MIAKGQDRYRNSVKVGPGYEDHVRLVQVLAGVGDGRASEGFAQHFFRGRLLTMVYGVDVVGVENSAHEFLDQIGGFISGMGAAEGPKRSAAFLGVYGCAVSALREGERLSQPVSSNSPRAFFTRGLVKAVGRVGVSPGRKRPFTHRFPWLSPFSNWEATRTTLSR